MTARHSSKSFLLPEIYFAPPGRDSPETVRSLVVRLGSSSLLSGVLECLGGWVAVLNDKRQVLAVNHALLQALGVEDPGQVLGLRPGEALKCVHAHDHPAGCGTSQFCSTCGAAIALVAAQKTGFSQENECILTHAQNGGMIDRVFMVQACPIDLDGVQLLLICMRDVSEEKRRAALERAFLHDISSLMSAIHIAAGVLRAQPGSQDAELIDHIRDASATVMREIRVQKLLSSREKGLTSLELASVVPAELLSRVKTVLAKHPAACDQEIRLVEPLDVQPVETDEALLLRVLTNLVLNALEAGVAGDRVEIATRADADAVEFRVWNRQAIDRNSAPRVFQQYFSTKPGGGRGLGTFSVKLIGEKILGGRTGFTSTPEEGTTFHIRLPRDFNVLPRRA